MTLKTAGQDGRRAFDRNLYTFIDVPASNVWAIILPSTHMITEISIYKEVIEQEDDILLDDGELSVLYDVFTDNKVTA